MRSGFLLLVVLLSVVNPASAYDDIRFSIFINPLKPFLGLFNLGIECQFALQYSLWMSAEYVAFRTRYLEKIDHPDFVGTIGVRYYFLPDEPDASGFFAGLTSGYIKRKSARDAQPTRDVFLGTELGYRFLLGDDVYVSPRVLLSVPMRDKTILPGAEALLGVILP